MDNSIKKVNIKQKNSILQILYDSAYPCSYILKSKCRRNIV